MPRFRARYRAADGREHARVLELASRQDVAAALQVPPHAVLAVDDLAGKSTPLPLSPASPPTLRHDALRLFCQELALLLESGIPVLEAIETLRASRASVGAAGVEDRVVQALRVGQSLSTALHGAGVDALTVAIVAASERSGQLPDALRQHAAYLHWVSSLRARLVKASVYPVTLLAVGLAVVLFLLVFVVPRFTGVLDGLRHELPWTSQLLVQVGRLAGAHPGLVLTVAVAPLVLAWGLWAAPVTRAAALRRAWRLPWVGEHLTLVSLARLYRALGLLLAAGAPAVGALAAVRATLPAHLQPDLDAAMRCVEQGQRLSDALERQGLSTVVAARMLRVGERTGELARMCERAAAFHDEEIARLSDLVTDVLNPALMLIVGVLVGGIIVLMYLPIFQLVEQLQ